jgi:K+-transporting ATPase KdpF subunit
LHDFYTADDQFCPVFPRAPLVCRHGFCLRRRHRRILADNPRFGRRLRCAGEKEVTWAYLLSGAVSIALLVYLVVALIRAEDL